jgi:hypothetical protein
MKFEFQSFEIIRQNRKEGFGILLFPTIFLLKERNQIGIWFGFLVFDFGIKITLKEKLGV